MLKILNIFPFLLAFVFTIGSMQSCKSKGAYNKYRHAKVRPSEKQIRADKKIMARSDKNYKKQLKTNRKKLFGRKTDQGVPRK